MLVSHILEEALEDGKNLKSTTIKGLQSGKYRIEVSGAVENYLKWPLFLKTCENRYGYVTTVLNNILPGVVEGFASRKGFGTTSGIWSRYSLVVDDDIMAHFTYAAPFSFIFHKNWLSVALCAKRSSLCRSMNADKMYYKNYSFMDRKQYYQHTYPVKICYDDICMSGTMENTHHPIVRIKVYPKSYYDLNSSIWEKAIGVGPKNYAAFMKSMFDL